MSYYNEEKYKKCVGKIVCEIEIDDDLCRLIFEDSTSLGLSLTGDCCSISEFSKNSREDVVDLIGAIIKSIEDRDNEEVRDKIIWEDEGEENEYHCVFITTDKGHVTLDWRNASNGNYGGTCTAIFR